MTRRDYLTALAGLLGTGMTSCQNSPSATGTGASLPLAVTFKGQPKFNALVARAQAEGWASLPLHERTATVGKALVGTTYQNFTLELSDTQESPCVNFQALDCWTFYETALAFARMLHHPGPHTPQDLLHYIELERYRDGHCDGTYLSRMHHLEEVFANNQQRGLGRNITAELGGSPIRRQILEMQRDQKSYRALVANPRYVDAIARIESRVSNLPVTYLPNERVPSAESSLRNGDIIAIVGADDAAYTTHVGMALRDGSRCRFMHATSRFDKGRQVVIDGPISGYLAESPDHIGIIVFRPAEA
jgi:hypothetical protein